MDGKSAIAAAGALVLVVAGGTSALVAAREPAPTPLSSITTTAERPEPKVVIEYVDEAGNTVATPGSQPTTEVRTLSVDREIMVEPEVEPEIIWIDAPGEELEPEIIWIDAPAAASGETQDADHSDDHDDDDHDD